LKFGACQPRNPFEKLRFVIHDIIKDMGIFSRSEKNKIGLVFDIGSSSVGGALFSIEDSKVPRIIFFVREPILLLEKMDADQFLSLALQSLSRVADKIVRSGRGAPEKIFCVLGAAWCGSQTRTVKLKKNSPFTFSAKLADELVQKEIGLFQEENLVRFLDEQDRVVPIELKNLRIALNGYPTSSPLGQKARELEMTLFISMSSKHFLEKVEVVISSHFHRKSAKFSSFFMATFTVVRDLSHLADFILVDVGGELTSLAMAKREILKETASFPIGRNYFIRETARELGRPLGEAGTLVSLYKDRQAEEQTHSKLEKVVGRLKEEWLKQFQSTLANLSGDISVPSTIFLTADRDLADFFSGTIQEEKLTQYILTESKFAVRSLDLEFLHGAASFEAAASRDSTLSVEAVYINRYLC
jgi:hypothetical protein